MTEAKTTKVTYKGVADALVAFQSDMPKVAKDATAKAGAYSYDYATLDRLVEIIFPRLTAVGKKAKAEKHSRKLQLVVRGEVHGARLDTRFEPGPCGRRFWTAMRRPRSPARRAFGWAS